MVITPSYRKFFQILLSCFCLYIFCKSFMLKFQRSLFWSIHIMDATPLYSKQVSSGNLLLAFIGSRSSTLPPFWIMSKYCNNVLISRVIFGFCTIYKNCTTVLISLELPIFILTLELNTVLFYPFMDTHLIPNYEYCAILLYSKLIFCSLSLI